MVGAAATATDSATAKGDSSPQQSRGKDSGGEKVDYSAEKSSKDGSNKSTSTPRKKPFQRGKGK